MNVRTQIFAALALALAAAPLAAFAAGSAPVSAGEIEAANRSGAIATAAEAPAAPAPAADVARRVHELVVNGASYNEAPARAAAEQAAGASLRETQPTQEQVQEGTGYTPSSYAAAAPTRG